MPEMGISLAKGKALVTGGGGGDAVNGFTDGVGMICPLEVAAAWLATGTPAVGGLLTSALAVARELGKP